MHFEVESGLSPEDCLRQLDSRFEVRLSPLREAFPWLSDGRPQRLAGRTDGLHLRAMLVGNDERDGIAYLVRLLRGRVDGQTCPVTGLLRGRIQATLRGSRIHGEVRLLHKSSVLASCIFAFLVCLCVVEVVIAVRADTAWETASFGALALSLTATLALVAARTARWARQNESDLIAIVRIAVTDQPDAGWWENQPDDRGATGA